MRQQYTHTPLTIHARLSGRVVVKFIEETQNSDTVSPGMLKVDGRKCIFGHNQIEGLVKPPAKDDVVSQETLTVWYLLAP